MNPALRDMLAAYQPQTPADYLHAAREVVQEIALLGLWRGGFFEHAAFYGGTALRIFHGLARFSEDLDFTLLDESAELRLDGVIPAVALELASWGFRFEAEAKSAGTRTGIESGFLKGNTQINLLSIGAPEQLAARLPRNQKIQIKLELDLRPPAFATTEGKMQLLPTPYQVRLYDLPSLFAGKLHALLCRGWKDRVKGRDVYDFVWYVGRKVEPNLAHLEARMRQSGHWSGATLTQETLRELLTEKFRAMDLRQAAEEVRPFLKDPRETELWSAGFFVDLSGRVGTSGK